MVDAAAEDIVERVKAFVFPVSAVLLFAVYPLLVLVWAFIEGRAANEADKEASTHEKTTRCKDSSDVCKPKAAAQEPVQPSSAAFKAAAVAASAFGRRIKTGTLNWRRTSAITWVGATVCVVSALGATAGAGFAFFASSGPSGPPNGGTAAAAGGIAGALRPPVGPGATTVAVPGTATAGLWALSAALAVGTLLGAVAGMRPRPSAARGLLKRCGACERPRGTRTPSVIRQAADGLSGGRDAPSCGASFWHHVELHARTWLDEDTGFFFYVNEIPRGALRKFEVQTKLPGNIISEDEKGSKKLEAFGKPVPFNYGCFPQTWRDPEVVDEIYGAGGDDDPLDVIDLTPEPCTVGQVTRCRPIGAVCLIDEGRADWKVFVVGVDSNSPLADCRSLDDVQRVAPGRVDEALGWMDAYKQFSAGDGTRLHAELHGPDQARRLVEEDHAAWCRLVSMAGPSGTVNGHWIHAPETARKVIDEAGMHAMPGPKPAAFAGSLPPNAAIASSFASVTARAMTLRRQASSDSDFSWEDASDVSSMSSGAERTR